MNFVRLCGDLCGINVSTFSNSYVTCVFFICADFKYTRIREIYNPSIAQKGPHSITTFRDRSLQRDVVILMLNEAMWG
jgi:hypothetical protein